MLNWKLFFSLFLFLTSSQIFSAEYTPTGFYYPLKTDVIRSGTGFWLSPARGHSRPGIKGTYVLGGVFHGAVDMLAKRGTAVYAIADGTVKYYSTGGWGSGNIAIVIRHKLALENRYFYTLYGHVSKGTAIKIGSQVVAGQVIGKIGAYPKGGDHLHFAIHNKDSHFSNVGTISMKNWPSTKTAQQLTDKERHHLVDPIWFIDHKLPDNYISKRNTQPNGVIDVTDPWFSELCSGKTGFFDSRCNLAQSDAAMDCYYEQLTLCTNESALPFWVSKSVNYVGAEGGGFAPDPDGTNGTPWDDYDHDVGLKYVKLCKKEGSGCKSSLDVEIDSLPRWDIRAKLKQKGGEWKDVDIDFYCSNDRDFGDDDDVHLGREGKKLSKSKYDDKKEKSVYLKNADLSSCITQQGRNYYLFVVVHYDGGKNASTENDGSEHVQLRVALPPQPTPVAPVSTPKPPAENSPNQNPFSCNNCIPLYIGDQSYWNLWRSNGITQKQVGTIKIDTGNNTLTMMIPRIERLDTDGPFQYPVTASQAVKQLCYNSKNSWDENNGGIFRIDPDHQYCADFGSRVGIGIQAVLPLSSSQLNNIKNGDWSNISIRVSQ